MNKYNHADVEKKWQKFWQDNKSFEVDIDKDKEKFYALVEFPYPSGQGLHVGHARPYTALDVVSRKKRLEEKNVLYPMGWDAFGLPTENYAIKTGIHPKKVTEDNVANFKNQLQSIGFSFDWSKEINTTDPDYYKWTQWIFIQMFKKGLAYKKEMPINWCPSCLCGLANEEVVNGKCERCGAEVEQKVRSQWMLKITEYADRLIEDLKDVDYFDRIKAQQINWIGRSIGGQLKFNIAGTEDYLEVFTTRPDTIYGATYMVIAPEHEIIEKYADKITNIDQVRDYRHKASHLSEFERTELVKDKTGVELLGLRAINPFTKKEIPIWISDYVLASYGTGAIMAVPAHDQRDYDFAKKFNLPMVQVVDGGDISKEAFTDIESGKMINSPLFDGLSVKEAKDKAIEYARVNGFGDKKVNYKLRDWIFSRQRYWGEPIPMIYCDKCGWVPLDEKDLPLTLPEVETYEPSKDGSSPISKMTDWVNTTCPSCGGPAKRETDTMPQWAGSSWYFMRYIDPHNHEELASKEARDYWLNVDWYNGGMEHTTLHLLYSRFWYKFLYDLGIAPTKEPYAKRTSHGMILGSNGEKMSKSRGNVINPNDIVSEYGADTLRTYEMFMGDFEKSAPWSTESLIGTRRYLDRVWKLADNLVDGDEYSKDLEIEFNQTIKKVSEDYETLKFNTGIAALMELLNTINKKGSINKTEFKTYLILLNPVAPHITEELWESCGFEGHIVDQTWPTYDEAKTVRDEIEYPVQINGKLRMKLQASKDASKDEVLKMLYESQEGKEIFGGQNIVKEIFVPGKIINIVVK
ncbi:leucine--tRNA ligase [Neofamilia massiliensis]|uniref:leucine--tRNA ligase n=1 Tax=Neofamilia massiliensis TaxID=1673724 RepID=UPI0006BB7437|nr:leucine--tRNA ligase [Neofamilia massiliensis]